MAKWFSRKGRFEPPYRLEITDGTTTIDLVHGRNGFYLADWRPTAAFYKEGGVFQSSPLSDGRNLVFKRRTNGIERFSLKISTSIQDGAIYDGQELRRLLEKAADYWSDEIPQDVPVYLIAQGKRETNVRYAIIYTGVIPEDENPFGTTWVQDDGRAVMDGLTLIIERGTAWLEQPPGTDTDIEIGASESYDGRLLGNVDSSGVADPKTGIENVFVANRRNTANLTDVYYYEDGGGTYSSNLMDASYTSPVPFWPPAVHSANDAVYFGIDTSLANSGPFGSIVFDIETGAAATTSYTIVWEYYNGAWVTLTAQDNTNRGGGTFDATGVNVVSWRQPTDWTAVAVNGVTAYWVRARMTALTGTFTRPTQQNRPFYSVVWPYVEFASTEVGGDIPALARILAHNRSADDATSQSLGDAYSDRLIMGLRRTDRGANFTAYLNASDEQNPSGVTVAIASVANVNTTLVTWTAAPTGRSYLVNAAGAQALLERLVITLDNTIASDFYGRFHAYGRFRDTSLGGYTSALKIKATSGGETITTQTATGNSLGLATSESYVDYGVIDLPPAGIVNSSDVTDSLEFTIMVSIPDAGTDVYIYDLILIPVDEWAGDFVAPNLGSTGAASSNRGDTYLDADSITLPRRDVRAVLRDESDQIVSQWQAITPQVVLKNNEEQRLWVLASQNLTGYTAYPNTNHNIAISRAQQYLSGRGNR